jgi:L-malate glycosyltransferase
LAGGIAVVGTQTGGTPEVLVDGVTGVTYAAGDSDDCEARLLSLMTNKQLYDEVSKKGSAIVCESFLIETMLDKIETQLLKLTSVA